MEKFKCHICEKEYKDKKWYDLHIEKCEPISEPLEQIKELSEDEILRKEVSDWFENLGGRRSANRYELERMIGWYFRAFPTSKVSMDWQCPSCMIMCYNKLKEYLNN